VPQFRDSKGRSWAIDINVTAVKRVRSLAGVDLLDLADGSLVETLIADPVKLADILYALCKPQADQAGVSDEQFGEGLAGDAIAGATDAMLESLAGFFQNPVQRANLTEVFRRTRVVVQAAHQAVQKRIEGGAIERAAEAALGISGATSTDSPASPASTPDPSPSGS